VDTALLGHRLADGLQHGLILAVLALAVALVLGGRTVLDAVQGQAAMVAAFLAWGLSSAGWPAAGAVTVAVVVAAGAGLLVAEAVGSRDPSGDRRDPDVRWVAVLVTVGSLLPLDALGRWVWGGSREPLPSVFAVGHRAAAAPVHLHLDTLAALAAILGAAVVLRFLLRHSRLGLAMRAVAACRGGAELAGVPAGRVVVAGCLLATGLGAVAGALLAPTVPAFDGGFLQGVLVLVAATLAVRRIAGPAAAAAAGLLVGVLQSLAGEYVARGLQTVLVLTLVAAALLLPPGHPIAVVAEPAVRV
jgi:branched-chain amino acid transport system permease protein